MSLNSSTDLRASRVSIITACSRPVIDVVMHQSLLGLGGCPLDGVELLSDIKARPPLIDHGDYGAEVARLA